MLARSRTAKVNSRHVLCVRKDHKVCYAKHTGVLGHFLHGLVYSIRQTALQ